MMQFRPVGEEPELERMRSWILAGRSDEDIALAFLVSVKVVRLVRRDVEAEVRPG